MRVSEPPLEDEVFAKVLLEGCTDVADVATRACEKFEWGVPTRVRLFLAAAGGEDPPQPDALVAAAADPTRCLGVGWPLARAGIVPGCWHSTPVSFITGFSQRACGGGGAAQDEGRARAAQQGRLLKGGCNRGPCRGSEHAGTHRRHDGWQGRARGACGALGALVLGSALTCCAVLGTFLLFFGVL